MKSEHKLSIVIPTLNEEEYLPKLLYALVRQSFKDFEVIVVDAKSKDKTEDRAKYFSSHLNLKFLSSDRASPAIQRNLGAKAAKGDYLLFLDADVIVTINFLRDIVHEFDERYIECATCLLIPISDKLIDKMMHGAVNFMVRTAQYTDPYAPGACILCTKRLFNRILGFDESLTLCEDHDLVGRAKELSKFRVLRSQRIYLSVRRLKKEGRLKLISKYMYVELCRKLLGSSPNGVEYSYGDYKT